MGTCRTPLMFRLSAGSVDASDEAEPRFRQSSVGTLPEGQANHRGLSGWWPIPFGRAAVRTGRISGSVEHAGRIRRGARPYGPCGYAGLGSTRISHRNRNSRRKYLRITYQSNVAPAQIAAATLRPPAATISYVSTTFCAATFHENFATCSTPF